MDNILNVQEKLLNQITNFEKQQKYDNSLGDDYNLPALILDINKTFSDKDTRSFVVSGFEFNLYIFADANNSVKEARKTAYAKLTETLETLNLKPVNNEIKHYESALGDSDKISVAECKIFKLKE